MFDKQEEIIQLLNGEVSYWDGLKSEQFWQEFRDEGQHISSIVYSSIALTGCLGAFFVLESQPIIRAVIISIAFSMLGIIIAQVHYLLRGFQLDKQIELIRATHKNEQN